jgi:four helix bundle protein
MNVPVPLPVPVPDFSMADFDSEPRFDHERLDVYQAAIEFVAIAAEMIERLPSGHAHLADQLSRASTSIALNIAEGAGEFSRREKARFYRMALRSATECAAILDVFNRLGWVHASDTRGGREILLRIVSMLTRMAQNLERTGRGTGTGTGTNKGEGNGKGVHNA